MAVYTRINNKQIKYIEKKYNIGKIINYSGIKKGIENTTFILKTKKNKYILTIYEKRVQKKDLPFFVNLMSGLSRLKVKCPVPIKDKKLDLGTWQGIFLFEHRYKNYDMGIRRTISMTVIA